MTFGVVVFPGSNCDQDTIYVLENNLNQDVKPLWHKDTELSDFTAEDCIILPGGFSYGDYLRSGAIARFSPLMEKVIEFANNGGYVLGICNGFQILCESGLLPGALLKNNNQKFVCKNVHIKAQSTSANITKNISQDKILKIPIAHSEGRYYADEQTLSTLNSNDQVLFRYCNEAGVIKDDANPNGSLDNIAGICNENKNVFGMMPHPERAVDEILNNSDGRIIFESLLNYVKA